MLKNFFSFRLRTQLIIVMLCMLLLFAGSFAYLQQVAEEKVLDLIQDQINGMMKAIEISIEQIQAAGPTDEARLKDFIEHLQKQGIEEVSILSKQQEVMLSSNPRLVGSRLSVLENEFLIQEKIGAEDAVKPTKRYSAFVPIISKGTLEGYIHISMYFEDLERLSREMLFKRIAWSLPILAVGLILCILIAYHYTKPIPVLIEAIHSISQGNLPNLPTNLHADISGLSDSLDTMFNMLASQKELQGKLKRSEHQAMLAQLASGIAHEIRNPLNFISLTLDHLGNLKSFSSAENEDDPRDLIRKTKAEIQRVNQLVTNFLDLGRELVLRPMPLKIHLAVEEALGINSQLIRDHGIAVERSYCDPIPVVEIDIDKMKSCFQNLIANAADAMPRGGILRIAITETVGSVELVFEDTGEGIRPDNLPKLFDSVFYNQEKRGRARSGHCETDYRIP